MLDIYLHAPMRESLIVDLAQVGLVEDGDFVQPPGGALSYVGPVPDGGVGLIMRCAPEFAATLAGATFSAGTVIADQPEGVPVFAGEPGLDLATVAAAKQAEITSGCAAALAPYAAEYDSVERDSWETQVREATVYAAYLTALETDPGAVAPATPFLDAACAARGMSHEDFTVRILAKPDPWATICGAIVGQRLALQDQVDDILAGDDPDTVKALRILAVEVGYEVPG